MRRKLILAASVLIVGAVAVALIGRWEATRANTAQLDGIARVRQAVGALNGPALAAYRVTPAFDCLVYHVGLNISARELCFDPTGGIVEAIDRTGPSPSFWSVRYEPSLAQTRVSPRRVITLLRALGAGWFVAGATDRIPVGLPDVGPILPGFAPPHG
jgi:hypothetical protein